MPTVNKETIKLTIKKIKNKKIKKLTGGRLQIKIAETHLSLGNLQIEGKKYDVLQRLQRGRYIIREASL